jgi:hypothetical protein
MDKHLTDNRVFDLIGLIVEGHHQGSKPIIVEQHEILLDRAPGTQLKGTAKVIVLESNVEELESTVKVSCSGTIVSKPNIEHPFTMFYSFNRRQLTHALVLNKSGLWSVSIPCSIGLQEHPLVLNNSVFSFELQTTDQFGSPYSLGIGRGFLVFADSHEQKIH